jgi:NADPH:quinone reductase-like Zn-dependent oxidoreductase
MRAIVQDRYGSTDVLRLEDIPTPEPTEGRVLLRVRAAGVDPSVWHIMTARPAIVRVMGEGVRKPKTRVRGVDVAGVVEKLGQGVTGVRPGDEVYGVCAGSFAEFGLAKAIRIAPKPSNLTFEEAAAVPVSATTALQGLRDKGGIRAGQRVLITGASGGVGTFAVQLAVAFGAEVTAVSGPSKVDLVRSLGAARVIDYTKEDFAATGERYDLILDVAGSPSIATMRRSLTPSGTAVIVGGEGGTRWFGGIGRNLWGIVRSRFGGPKVRSMLAMITREDLETLTGLIEAGKLAPVIDRTYPLERTAEAVAYQQAGHARGKVVVVVSGS